MCLVDFDLITTDLITTLQEVVGSLRSLPGVRVTAQYFAVLPFARQVALSKRQYYHVMDILKYNSRFIII